MLTIRMPAMSTIIHMPMNALRRPDIRLILRQQPADIAFAIHGPSTILLSLFVPPQTPRRRYSHPHPSHASSRTTSTTATSLQPLYRPPNHHQTMQLVEHTNPRHRPPPIFHLLHHKSAIRRQDGVPGVVARGVEVVELKALGECDRVQLVGAVGRKGGG